MDTNISLPNFPSCRTRSIRAKWKGRVHRFFCDCLHNHIMPKRVRFFKSSFFFHQLARLYQLFTDDRVFIHLGDKSQEIHKVPHIQLSRWADLFIIVPATANIVGKAANGIADDLLSTTILASPKPVIFVPVMNPAMWKNNAFQRNIQLLEHDGHETDPRHPSPTSVKASRWSVRW